MAEVMVVLGKSLEACKRAQGAVSVHMDLPKLSISKELPKPLSLDAAL